MKTGRGVGAKQGGAVAIIVGLLSALVFFGLLGIAVDLSRLYSRKTELQNAADAAALSGAKDLDQTAAGVGRAIDNAVATFAQNAASNLIDGVTITSANIRLGSCPNPSDRLPLRAPSCAFVSASSVSTDTQAIGMTFLEVDTGPHSNAAFFMPVQTRGAVTTTTTYGYAVAGRFVNDVTPIGICAVSTTKRDSYGTGELLEYGFRRGMSYDLMKLGPLSGSSVPYLVNPVDTDPATCQASHSSANFTAPFVCTGNSAVVQSTAVTSKALGNTGLSDVVLKALNSRFGLYTGAYGTNQCDPATAPPDSNVMQYCYRTAGGAVACPAGAPRMIAGGSTGYGYDYAATASWSSTTQFQTVQLNASNKPNYNATPNGTGYPGLAFKTGTGVNAGPNNGVLWSYGPAYHATGSGSSTGVGNPFTAAQANAQAQMYNNVVTPMTYFDTATYPANYPYFNSLYRQGPSSNGPGMPNRRVLNLLIIDCPNATGSGACGQQLPVLGIGRFFMQTMADPTGSTKRVYVEYAGLIDPVPMADIKLYR